MLRKRVADERGVALVLAMLVMIVLAVSLASVISFTTSNSGHTSRSNASQISFALAEEGLNNALAVLIPRYPGTNAYPGDPAIFTNAGCTPTCTTSTSTGSVDWTGTLQSAPAGSSWSDEWQLTATATVRSPIAASALVSRTVRAVVPIVLPSTLSAARGVSPLGWIYANNDVTLSQTVTVAAPVYAGHDITLRNSAKISENAVKLAAEHNLILTGPQNRVGHVNGSADPANALSEVHVANLCQSQANGTPHACQWGAVDQIFAVTHDNVIPAGLLTKPTLTCCAPYGGTIAPAAPVGETSSMGFWYRNADLGPHAPCSVVTGTPPRFDTAFTAPDNSINQSATSGTAPFDLTPNASYTCRSMRAGAVRGELSYNHITDVLTVKGVVFIDGSATSTATNARYVGQGSLILSGTYTMDVNTVLCVHLSGSNCDTASPWDPDHDALIIIAAGEFGTDLSSQSGTAGNGIEIKKGHFQGALIANKSIDASVSGTEIQGPIVSVYANVSAGQSGTLSFPAIGFPSSGAAGITEPLPLPELLAAQSFAG